MGAISCERAINKPVIGLCTVIRTKRRRHMCLIVVGAAVLVSCGGGDQSSPVGDTRACALLRTYASDVRAKDFEHRYNDLRAIVTAANEDPEHPELRPLAEDLRSADLELRDAIAAYRPATPDAELIDGVVMHGRAEVGRERRDSAARAVRVAYEALEAACKG